MTVVNVAAVLESHPLVVNYDMTTDRGEGNEDKKSPAYQRQNGEY